MRYFTKEWYSLSQADDYTENVRMIKDGTYTDEDIEEIYNNELIKYICEERKIFEDKTSYDDLSGDSDYDDSYEDEYIDDDYTESFDEEELKKRFRNNYLHNSEISDSWFPAWVGEYVDKRLLALSLIPETVYKKLKEEEKKNKKEVKAIMNEAKEELSKQNLPESVKRAFLLDDTCILSITNENDDCVMTVRKNKRARRSETPYDRIVFLDAVITEQDENLIIEKEENFFDKTYYSDCNVICSEIYEENGNYEVHLLLFIDEPMYFTVRCKDVFREKNIEL